MDYQKPDKPIVIIKPKSPQESPLPQNSIDPFEFLNNFDFNGYPSRASQSVPYTGGPAIGTPTASNVAEDGSLTKVLGNFDFIPREGVIPSEVANINNEADAKYPDAEIERNHKI